MWWFWGYSKKMKEAQCEQWSFLISNASQSAQLDGLRECHASRTHQPVITLERKQIWGRMFHCEVARLFNDGARLFRHISIIHQLFSFSFLSCWENWLKSYQYLQWSNWFPYIDTDPWFDFRGFERNVRQIKIHVKKTFNFLLKLQVHCTNSTVEALQNATKKVSTSNDKH